MCRLRLDFDNFVLADPVQVNRVVAGPRQNSIVALESHCHGTLGTPLCVGSALSRYQSVNSGVTAPSGNSFVMVPSDNSFVNVPSVISNVTLPRIGKALLAYKQCCHRVVNVFSVNSVAMVPHGMGTALSKFPVRTT